MSSSQSSCRIGLSVDACENKPYAVVTFINESDPSDESISEVPTKWLTDDRANCYWPSSTNTNLYIKRLLDPRKFWPLHPVRVDGYYDTLKDAQKQVSNESSSNTETENQGRGCRNIKAPSPFSPDEDFQPKSKKLKQTSKPPGLDGSLKHASWIHNNSNKENEIQIDGFTDSYALGILSQHTSNEVVLNGPDQQNNSQLLSVADQQLSNPSHEGNFASGSGNYFESIANLESRPANRLEYELSETRHTTLVNMLSDIFIQLGEIRQDIAGITKNPKISPNDDVKRIQNLLPCKKLEEFQELEELVKSDEKYRNIWYQIVKSTGGNGSRDFILRVLRKLVTNSVAEVCSWTGAKNNFKIKDMTIFQIFIAAVQDSTGVTQCDFEIFVKEWLRHSKQRREREENRNK